MSDRGISVRYDIGEDEWVLLESLRRDTRIGRVTVPAGFRTDLASVPWRLVWRKMFRQWGAWTEAAIVHDFLYRAKPGGVTKEQADLVFLDLLEEDGVNLGLRRAMYRAVACFGDRAWNA